MERRKFIKNVALSSAAGLVLPTIIPGTALGKNGAFAPSERLEIALIGCGGMGRGNVNNLHALGNVECVALCDVHKAQIDKAKSVFAEKGHPIQPKEFEDYRDLLSYGKFDAAVIATPDQWHGILYSEFANAGYDIYGEKPLVRKLNEGRIVVDAVKKNNIVWQTGSWQRSKPNFAKACELVQSNAIGKIQRIEVGLPDFNKSVGMPPVKTVPSSLNYDKWLGPAPQKPYRGILHFNWRWMMDYSGGQLTDWIGHHMDIALWSMNMEHTGPTEIEAKATFKEGDLFDVPHEFNIKTKFENGLPVTIANAAQLQQGMGVCWYGEKGWIHVSRRKFHASDEKILQAKVDPSITKFRHGQKNHVANFVHCIKTRETPIADIESAHRAISVGLLGEIAYLTGEKLEWDPAKEQFIGASSKATAMLSPSYRNPYQLAGL